MIREHILSKRTPSVVREHILSKRTHSESENTFRSKKMHAVLEYQNSRRRARGCWLAAGKIECVLLLQNVFPYSRMCSLTLERADAGKIECVLLL